MPPETTAAETPICGARKRKGDGVCTLPAGWGTPYAEDGIGRCKLHGGLTPTHVKASAVASARAELHALAIPAPEDSVQDSLELVVRLKRTELNYYTTRIGRLRDSDVMRKGRLSPWIEARDRAAEQLARFSKMALDAGVDERRLRIEEGQQAAVAAVLSGVIRDLEAAGLPQPLRAVARESVERRVLELAADTVDSTGEEVATRAS